MIGVLEDLIMDDTFLHQQQSFIQQYCHEFENTEENKLSYTSIYQQYTTQVELQISTTLQRIGYTLNDLIVQCELHSEIVNSGHDVFEILATIGDFQAFKQMMLDYKNDRTFTSIASRPTSGLQRLHSSTTTSSTASASSSRPSSSSTNVDQRSYSTSSVVQPQLHTQTFDFGLTVTRLASPTKR